MNPDPVIRSRFPLQLTLPDLSSLSISSVAPLFSLAAAGQMLVRLTGPRVLWAVLAVAVPFVLSSTIFRLLNRHFPNAGASYHWSRRVLGPTASRFQSWILLMAYFWSLPPIVIPAATQTLALAGLPRPAPPAVVLAGAGWVAFATGVLLLGSRVTARVTQAFLVLEVAAVAVLAAVGLARWHPVAAPAGPLPLRPFAVAMVVAATIVDGWEIDSYAAEEARRPRTTPGTGGMAGALLVLAYYGLAWTVLLHTVPVPVLAAHSDVLTTWAAAELPGAGRWALLPILASTAGSLWLTTFILSRALYAMGRDRLLPAPLTRLNRFHAPVWAIALPAAGALAVVAVNLAWPSVTALFNLVLSSAGFFLVLEFLFDSVTAAVFLARQHPASWPHARDRHRHRGLLVVSVVTSLWLAGIAGLFLRYGGAAVGPGLDAVLAVLLGGGTLFSILAARRQRSAGACFIFEPEAPGPEPVPPL
ncbi:MAG: APC family permease [Firmicutes bacterium]|nr:APC family permease [Bacillota bacterium]